MAASMQRFLLGVFVLCTLSLCWFLYALHNVAGRNQILLQQATTMPQNVFFQLMGVSDGVKSAKKRSPTSMAMIESDATAWLSSHQLLLIPAQGKNNSYIVKSGDSTNWTLAAGESANTDAAAVVEFASLSANNGKRAQFVQVYSQRRHQQRSSNINNADYYEPKLHQFDYSKTDQNMPTAQADAVELQPTSLYKSSLDAVSDHSTTYAQTCSRKTGPAQHIVFAKTHKCGSSTVQSILLRYADEHKFHIAFPKPRYFNYYVPFPKRFRAEAIYDWGVTNPLPAAAHRSVTTTASSATTNVVQTETNSPASRPYEKSKNSNSVKLDKQRRKRSVFPPNLHSARRQPISVSSATSTSASTTVTPPPYQPNFNLMCFHSRFDYNEARRAMPQPDTVFITIVRDPVAQFESIYTFYRLGRVFANATFEEFIMQPETYTEAYPDNYVYRSRNPMMFDFGLDPHLMDNGTAVMQKILEIERQFDLVLIADLMDESLILLRDLLCWDWGDMVAFRKNTRMNQFRLRALDHNDLPTTPADTPSSAFSSSLRQNRAASISTTAASSETSAQQTLEENERRESNARKIADAVRRWNWADQMLYDHFSSKLRALLAAKQKEVQFSAVKQRPLVQDPRQKLHDGIERLRHDRQAWMDACVRSELAPLQVERMFREYGGLSSSFQLRDTAYANRTCVQLALPELQYIKQLFAKQHPEIDGGGT